MDPPFVQLEHTRVVILQPRAVVRLRQEELQSTCRTLDVFILIQDRLLQVSHRQSLVDVDRERASGDTNDGTVKSHHLSSTWQILE
ncbi:hypothetical protein PC116_g32802 [Phytophthora cactorum]|nr:hypothetical protein C6341_g27661 [Phytophthora cactorum]KAG4218718.1 hypothetical protein PC116_g32802 [Phytophthora cactorum]